MQKNPLRSLLKCNFDPANLVLGPEFCIFKKLPSDKMLPSLGHTLSNKDLENIPVGLVSPRGMAEAAEGCSHPSNPIGTSRVGPSCLEHHPDMLGQPGLSSRPCRVLLVASLAFLPAS